MSLSELETFVFVDASNIRSCCLKTLGWKPSFVKMGKYFTNRYQHLKEVRYYEGIADNDTEKHTEFGRLSEAGYIICALQRKSYTDETELKGKVDCKQCGTTQQVRLTKRVVKLKSSIDVYLATELLKIAYSAEQPVHIILVSCDGDYAEMIKAALDYNKNVYVSVIATPVVKNRRNTCSTRLQGLRRYSPNFYLIDIRDIEKYIRE